MHFYFLKNKGSEFSLKMSSSTKVYFLFLIIIIIYCFLLLTIRVYSFFEDEIGQSVMTLDAIISQLQAAFERQSYGDARGYLTNLLNKLICPTNEVAGATSDCCPRDVYADALFAYGDVFAADSSVDASRFGTARTAFQRLVSDGARLQLRFREAKAKFLRP